MNQTFSYYDLKAKLPKSFFSISFHFDYLRFLFVLVLPLLFIQYIISNSFRLMPRFDREICQNFQTDLFAGSNHAPLFGGFRETFKLRSAPFYNGSETSATYTDSFKFTSTHFICHNCLDFCCWYFFILFSPIFTVWFTNQKFKCVVVVTHASNSNSMMCIITLVL